MAPQLRLPPLPTVKDIIRLYKLRAMKQLSQNFLLDSRITDKFVRAAGGRGLLEGAEACEVGPGPGPITRSVLDAGVSKLSVVEKDPRFEPALKLISEAAPGRLQVILGDVLDYDLRGLFTAEPKPWQDENIPRAHLLGNLPFSVSTPLIIRWMRDVSMKRNAWTLGRVPMTLTFQQEVAERIVARVRGPQRCRLSIMTQAWCKPALKFTIPGRAFVPAPDVNVGVVHLVPRAKPLIQAPFHVVEKFIRSTFAFRQKCAVKGAARLFPVAVRDKLTTELFTNARVSTELRPFELRLHEWSHLCDVYWAMCQVKPELFDYNHRAPMSQRGEQDWVEYNPGELLGLEVDFGDIPRYKKEEETWPEEEPL